jgi:serine/threonine protein kinase
MQYAAHGDLSGHISDSDKGITRSFGNPTQKAQLICDIVLGMRYVHSRGIMHRDLKPDNIFLDENRRGLIGDFGLSRSIPTGAPSTSCVGNGRYAPPEQLAEGSPYNNTIDVFAFGLIAYEIIGDRALRPGERLDKGRQFSAAFGPFMQKWIPRYCSWTASDRPSFAEIHNEFASRGFAILPGADADAISKAVSDVLQAEEHCSRPD